MQIRRNLNVAVLLATYNGSRYVTEQIESLRNNSTPFTLHWLDDGSTDNTREVVRSSTRSVGIKLAEWHQTRHLGLPSSFFQLLECVEADVYLFCDQDDIWQPHKIDAMVENLVSDLASPLLCFCDYFFFKNGEPEKLHRMSDFIGLQTLKDALDQPPTLQMFSRVDSCAQAQGFTRPLRDLFLTHKDIAYRFAFMHDWWMYDIAIAAGTTRMIFDAPTSLWRRHGDSFCSRHLDGLKRDRISTTWRDIQFYRRSVARHAQGFIFAAPTFTPGKNLDRLMEFARFAAGIDRRQTLASINRILRSGLIWKDAYFATSFLAICLSSNATTAAAAARSTSIAESITDQKSVRS